MPDENCRRNHQKLEPHVDWITKCESRGDYSLWIIDDTEGSDSKDGGTDGNLAQGNEGIGEIVGSTIPGGGYWSQNGKTPYTTSTQMGAIGDGTPYASTIRSSPRVQPVPLHEKNGLFSLQFNWHCLPLEVSQQIKTIVPMYFSSARLSSIYKLKNQFGDGSTLFQE